MIHLSHEELAIIRTILQHFVQQGEVRVFGSRFRGDHRQYSDLDLVIVDELPIDSKIIEKLSEAFDNSALTFRVEILDWQQLSVSFRGVIDRGYEIIYRA
jgi:predicted nucleotidyltransferase